VSLFRQFRSDFAYSNVTIAASDTCLPISNGQLRRIKVRRPHLIWPPHPRMPHLYSAKLSFEIGKQVSDAAIVTFGIREVTSELTEKGHRLFKPQREKSAHPRGGLGAGSSFSGGRRTGSMPILA